MSEGLLALLTADLVEGRLMALSGGSWNRCKLSALISVSRSMERLLYFSCIEFLVSQCFLVKLPLNYNGHFFTK